MTLATLVTTLVASVTLVAGDAAAQDLTERSGVLISPDGTILTAAHVVDAMDDITVEFAGGDTVRARVIASEPGADLSLLVVGAPYGLGRTMSVGWISGRHAPSTLDGTFRLAGFFQTDAAINTGNSGGPMFDAQGRVIGVVSQLNLPQPAGLLIKTLAKASPLATAGLRAGSVPANVNGETLTT